MRIIRLLAVLGIAAAAAAIVIASGEDPATTSQETAETGRVEWVIDGDTVDLVIGGQEERVRLIGVDAPESVSRDTPVQCFGEEASTALKGLLPVDTLVRLERDTEARDRFGRLLLYIYRVEDDLFVNEWLISNGYADTLFFEPNTAYRSSFTELRNAARSAPVGLWARCEGPDQPLE
ncbi:MAG: thermonuclease family protein [Acidimicrobiales bacterium]